MLGDKAITKEKSKLLTKKSVFISVTALTAGALLASLVSIYVQQTLYVEKTADITVDKPATIKPTPTAEPQSKKVVKKAKKVKRVYSNKPRAPLTPMLPSFNHEGFTINKDHVTINKPFKEKLLRNPNLAMKMAEGAKMFPRVKNGKLLGFTLTRIKDNSLLFDAGLRNGDTIEAINGVFFTNIMKAAQNLTALRKATKGSIRLRRGRKVRTIRIKIQ